MEEQTLVTKELAASVRYHRLNNSDTDRKTWGIWRYVPGGVIEEEKYSYDTNTIGPYTFPEEFGYVEEFYSKVATPPKRLLYKYMLELNCVLACIFVNNSFVARVMTDRIEYIDLEDKSARDVRMFSTPLEQKCLVDIGWVKTKVKDFSACTLPHKLHMDLSNNQAYIGNGQWVPVPGNPQFFMEIDFPLYKQLLEHPTAVAVYRDLNDGETKYL